MRLTFIVIFLVSCSVLTFEVSLTRIFSISLWYHFAFLVISIAMLGIGSAGTLLSIAASYDNYIKRIIRHDNLKKFLFFGDQRFIVSILSLSTGIAIISCYVASNYIPFDPARFSWDKYQFLYLTIYCLVLSIPFFFAGILIAYTYSMYSEYSMSIYSSDLIGAGTGSLIVLILLNVTSPENSIIFASALCMIGAFISRHRSVKIISLLLILFDFALILVHPPFIEIRISQYKSFPLYLHYPDATHLHTFNSSYSRVDVFKSPGIRFAPGLSLQFTGSLPEQVGIAIDADRIDVITSGNKASNLYFFEYMPASTPYWIKDINRALVLDPGGGLHVLMAKYYGSGEIHKVESNPLIVKVISENFSAFSGGIYDLNTWTGYGRNYLNKLSTKKLSSRPEAKHLYDLIDMPLTGVTVSGNFGISEDYRLTVEAFGEYLKSLNKDGILSISLYLIPPPRTEFRVLATAVEALEQNNLDDVSKNIIALRSWDSMTILIKKSAFTSNEIMQIKRSSEIKNFDLVYYPGISDHEANRYIKTPSPDHFIGFRNIIDSKTRIPFMDRYLFDIQPVHDKNPFFNYFLRLVNIKAIYKTMSHNWLYFINEGYMLPVIFLVIMMLSIFIILLPVFISSIFIKYFSDSPQTQHSFSLPTLAYFAMLGLGFMLIEVSIIQKSILIFENPSYAIAIVLFIILLSSGLGSMSASKFSLLRSPYSLVALSFIACAYIFILNEIFISVSILSLYLKVLVMFLVTLPLGFFMGLPFPIGMRLLGQKNETMIPWAWAINACFSVLSPILAILLALTFGFNTVLGVAVLIYLVAFISLKKLNT